MCRLLVGIGRRYKRTGSDWGPERYRSRAEPRRLVPIRWDGRDVLAWDQSLQPRICRTALDGRLSACADPRCGRHAALAGGVLDRRPERPAEGSRCPSGRPGAVFWIRIVG